MHALLITNSPHHLHTNGHPLGGLWECIWQLLILRRRLPFDTRKPAHVSSHNCKVHWLWLSTLQLYLYVSTLQLRSASVHHSLQDSYGEDAVSQLARQSFLQSLVTNASQVFQSSTFTTTYGQPQVPFRPYSLNTSPLCCFQG